MSAIKIFTGNSNIPLAQGVCEKLGLPLGKAMVTSFPDQESFVRIEENIRGADVFLMQSTCPPANEHFMELLIMIDAVRRASANKINVVMPFFGYARQDRKDQPRVPITAKLIANLITAAGASRVLAIDLHAQQIQGFFDLPFDHLYASPVFSPYLKKLKEKYRLSIFSPDVGGMKMAAAYATMLKVPLGFVAKRRTNAYEVEAFNLVGEVQDRDVLIIDDMTETAGTITAAAKLLKAKGARSIRALVTHGVLRPMAYEKLREEPIEELITTDTTPVDPKDLPIKVLSTAELIAKAIAQIHENKSISELFEIKGF